MNKLTYDMIERDGLSYDHKSDYDMVIYAKVNEKYYIIPIHIDLKKKNIIHF